MLLVTGVDYPGHLSERDGPGRSQTPRAGPAFEVRIIEDPEFLASPAVFDYDVILLHFKTTSPSAARGRFTTIS